MVKMIELRFYRVAGYLERSIKLGINKDSTKKGAYL